MHSEDLAMRQWLRKILAPPVFEDDEEKTRIAKLLNIILIIVMVLVMLFSVPALLMTPEIGRVVIELGLAVLALFMLLLLRRGHVQMTGFLLSLILWVMITYGTFEAAGFRGSTMSSYFGIIVIAALLLGPKMGILFGLLSIVATFWMYYADQSGFLPVPPNYATQFTLWGEFAVTVLGVIWLLELIMTSLQRALNRARQNELALAEKVKEAQNLANQAIEANEFKTHLLSRVSHELRTPLSVMLGMTEMLTTGDMGALNDEQKRVLQRILVNSKYLESTFAEILDQTQIESGQLKLKSEIFTPRTVLERVYASYLALAEKKGLALRYEVAENMAATVCGDEHRIQQIISNLTSNAIKFTPKGMVRIRIYMPDDEHWTIRIDDSGAGISPEDLNLIFEPFRQVDETTSREYGGVGLGLTIVKQLVNLMQGKLEVESQLGLGSTFSVTLPLRAPETVPG